MSHVMMKKSLAKALMDSGIHDISPEHVQRFGLGGVVDSIFGGGGGSSAKSNYTPPPIVKQDFLPQIQTQQNNQAQTYGQQQSLANTLLSQSNGTGGLSPAQNQLNQQTGNNVANQAALMAGQRGASANVGAIARLAAQQGANTQQQSVGQAATLEAQERLAAQTALQNQYAQMANQSLQGEQIQQTGQAAQNNAINAGELGTDKINSDAELENQKSSNGITGGFLNSLGSALPMISKGVGGLFSGGGSSLLAGGAGDAAVGGAGGLGAAIEGLGPAAVALAYDGGEIPKKSFSRALLDGGAVPGQAKVEGNSVKNDTEPTMLSPGEVVLPRSVTQSPNASQKAAEFMKHIQDDDTYNAKKDDYGSVISARKSLKDRVAALEKCMGGKIGA